MSSSALLRRLRAEDGMGIIEAMTAAMILLVGILSTFAVLDGSRNLVTVSERKEVAVHHGQLALEEMAARTFAEIATAQPNAGVVTDANDPRNGTSGGPPVTHFRSDTANPIEPLVIGGTVASRQCWPDPANCNTGRISGTTDTWVTQVGTTTDLKRVTVAVRLYGSQGPRRPIYLSTLVSQQAAGVPTP
jgi:hypothetical protein